MVRVRAHIEVVGQGTPAAPRLHAQHRLGGHAGHDEDVCVCPWSVSRAPKQAGGAVPHVVAAAPRRGGGHHRQDRLIVVERLDLRRLVDSDYWARSDGSRYNATMSLTLSTNNGSVESLSLRAVRSQIDRPPDLADRCRAHPLRLRPRAGQPDHAVGYPTRWAGRHSSSVARPLVSASSCLRIEAHRSRRTASSCSGESTA